MPTEHPSLPKNVPVCPVRGSVIYPTMVQHIDASRALSIGAIEAAMSGEKVMPTVESARFLDAFSRHCPGVPIVSVPYLLELNLGVAKNISGIEPEGPLVEWIARTKAYNEGISD